VSGRSVALAIHVGVHVRDDVVVNTVVHADESRVTLTLNGVGSTGLTLFVPRAGLERLADAVSGALAELVGQRAELTVNGPGAAGAA